MNSASFQTAGDRQFAERAIMKGAGFLASLQQKDGSWTGDYGGPMFLLPMFIAACSITGEKIGKREREGFIRYYRSVQGDDGSIGLHAEESGSMFTTVLGYVALRILGVPRTDAGLTRMRTWILTNGGALGAASWGKFVLALLNLYPYEGLNPILPELMALPSWLPFHPSRFWCHTRQVYLPMAWLYGIRAGVPENDFIRELRRDLYPVPYETIDFTRHRNTIAPMDNYRPYSLALNVVNALQVFYEKLHSRSFRKRALDLIFGHVLYEDRATQYIDIGPVNSVLNTLVHFFTDPRGEHYVKSMSALREYLCEGHDGMKMNGYNSTKLWDTAFAVQAYFAAGMQEKQASSVRRAYSFIKNNQILKDEPECERWYRHRSTGGWPFSDRRHGWPITDCTAEGFKAAILVADHRAAAGLIPEELLEAAIRLILSFQNPEGGWSTYELRRGPGWYERINPSSVFGDIMVDYPYVECTSSCLQALAVAKERFGGKLRGEIERSMARGAGFIRRAQRADGGFEGSWAVCFTYGAWFGVWGLRAAGEPVDSPAIARACEFLLSHQRPDGGWGEHGRSCRERQWVEHEDGQAVNTAWALMALVAAGRGRTEAADRAARFLAARQMKNGDWPRESMVGVFNKTALINYENYRRYFPLWALGVYNRGAIS